MESKFLISISSRPPRSALALSHAPFSSPAHGAISLPSKIKRHCLGLSIVEILNISSFLYAPSIRAMHMPNLRSRNLKDFQSRFRQPGVERLKLLKHARHRRIQSIDLRTDHSHGLTVLLRASQRRAATGAKAAAREPPADEVASRNGGVPSDLFGSFTDGDQWPHLVKKGGSWKLDANLNVVQGKGVHEFLLSRHSYGNRNVSIKARVSKPAWCL